MKTEDALLYLCCTQDVQPHQLESLVTLLQAAHRHTTQLGQDTLDWQQIFTLAHDHGVAPLVYQSLQAASAAGAQIPPEVHDRFRLASYLNMLAKQKQASRLAEVLAYLHENQIDAMLIKGLALDLCVYRQPWYTVANDIDLVLRSRCPESRSRQQAQVKTRFSGLGVEFEFDTHHDMTLNQTIPIDFERIWHDARVVEVGGYPVYLMSPEDTLLSICINSCRKRYFRLRSLCDIAETIKHHPDLNWNLFARKALDAHANQIAYTALTVTQATIGCSLPSGVLDQHRSLALLSYYNGPKLIGRKFGWSLLLPYTTYRWHQMRSKLYEAVTTYLSTFA
jgi:hypothetical protein